MLCRWFRKQKHSAIPLPPIEFINRATPWLTQAIAELGVSEAYGPKNNPRIIEYHQATTLKANDDLTAWCASFVCWCLEQAGYKSTQSAWAKDYISWGKKVERPYPGCIVIFHRGSRNQYGHVGFYLSEKNGKIKLLGGNQSNKVSIGYYSKRKLIGYREPKPQEK